MAEDREKNEKSERLWLSRIGVAAAAIGLVWRWYWIFHAHRATQFIYSDMEVYVSNAKRFLDPNYVSHIWDAYYPPGTSLFLAGLYWFDPSWELAMTAQFLISLCIPLIVAGIAREIYGWRAAWWAFSITCIYYPFIDFACFFISENPFIFLMVLGFWLMLVSLRVQSHTQAVLRALASGVIVGASLEFKGQGLLPALCVSAVMVYCAIRFKWRRMWMVFGAMTVGVLLVVAPFAARATRLNEGRFCLIANSGSLNFLMGHELNSATFILDDRKRGFCCEYTPPPLAERHLNTPDRVERFMFGSYDSDQIMAVAWERINKNRWEALGKSFDNVFELFIGFVPFPSSGTQFRRMMDTFQHLYQIFILLPCLFYLMLYWRHILRRDPRFIGDILLLVPLLGLIVMSFLLIGEARYRIPFDAFMIILAVRFYSGRHVPVDNVFTRAAAAAGIKTGDSI